MDLPFSLASWLKVAKFSGLLKALAFFGTIKITSLAEACLNKFNISSNLSSLSTFIIFVDDILTELYHKI
ncbi:MAG TPA: hypothetical protein DCS06_03360 [Candidatus Yanofskybacteria bacterium]|nr:hypothetical protein [Candidatus Yanofskybacteria bacterium]HBX58470.1 hypothetical protein [Candidatus Yanofskybacteria bacterium]